jgi:hypothetical protein
MAALVVGGGMLVIAIAAVWLSSAAS